VRERERERERERVPIQQSDSSEEEEPRTYFFLPDFLSTNATRHKRQLRIFSCWFFLLFVAFSQHFNVWFLSL
jgi:hypothetical protein